MTDEPVSSPQIRDVRVLRIAAVTVAASLIAWWPAFTLGVYGTIFFEQIFALWAAATATFLVAVLMLGRRAWTQPAMYSLLVPSAWIILTWLTSTADNNGMQDFLFWFGVVVTILGFPEMNRYRYDVIVHKTPAPVRSLASTPTWTWTECAGAGGFDTRLTSERPAAVRIVEIPRAGLITDVHIEQALAAGLPLDDALAQASAAEPPDTVTPEQLHRLGEAIGYRVAVTWGARPGTLDAVFITANDAELQRIRVSPTFTWPPPRPAKASPTRTTPQQHQDQRGASAVERTTA